MFLAKHYGRLYFMGRSKVAESYDVEFPFQIWDKNAEKIKKIDEYTGRNA